MPGQGQHEPQRQPQRQRKRKVIRRPLLLLAGALGCALVAVLISVPFVNDAAARQVERELLALPVPEHTQVLDSASEAGRFAGAGNGMEYLGAVLIKSALSQKDIEGHYSGSAAVLAPGDDEGRLSSWATQRFPEATVHNTYIIYAFGEAPSEFHRQIDLRGH